MLLLSFVLPNCVHLSQFSPSASPLPFFVAQELLLRFLKVQPPFNWSMLEGLEMGDFVSKMPSMVKDRLFFLINRSLSSKFRIGHFRQVPEIGSNKVVHRLPRRKRGAVPLQ